MSEINADTIAKTQKSLGKYVKKPALGEKLLRKPPFRFLHDVIRAVIKETGFLKGLFTEVELNSENVKEKEAKVAFLNKLIDAVKTVSKTELKVRSSKIVAGLEPTETNILLQTIAKCIDKKIDTTDYVKKVNSGENLAHEKSTKKPDKEKIEKKTSSRESIKKRDLSKTREKNVKSTPKSTDRETTKDSTRKSNKELSRKKTEKEDSSKKQESSTKKVKEQPIKNSKAQEEPKTQKDATEEPLNIKVTPKEEKTIEDNKNDIQTRNITPEQNDKTSENEENNQEPTSTNEEVNIQSTILNNFSNVRQSSAGLVRPKSARPKSSGTSNNERQPQSIKADDKKQKELNSNKITARPSSSLRPPSVRPPSARPGAPRLRPDSAVMLPVSDPIPMGNINVIVEQFDNVADEEDTVVIQNAPEGNDLGESDGLLESITKSENKGQLVEQILEKIQENEDGVKKKVEIDWEQDGLRGKDATTREVTQLRSLIQNLTKSANPLGKLMNYLHEDLEAMHRELKTWTDTKKQLYMEIEKQKKLAVESSKPLLEKLERLKEETKKQEQEILIVRSNILRNDQKISELLGNK
ncbi:TRAF3-interacting protein 1 [Anthonomus grandis grandis]|uniref:TRAF3-interacting protein 1 n=1 Tax=Anthonomus grandis grandis TaxID=2921223 RepID=UPI002165AA0E|nr:TRAF3-interacting protein 1 [Anthonomus grandis grandis]